MNHSRVIIALDYARKEDALALVRQLDSTRCRVKVGKEMFTRFGPALVEELQSIGFDVFLDLKFHDIPNTVARAVDMAAQLGVWMVNVHAMGGRRMMEAASEILSGYQHPPLLIAVTVLTSMDQQDLADIGIRQTPSELASQLSMLAKDSGLDGVVCSAHEAAQMRDMHGPNFHLVTPGIRPQGSASDDQRRIMTPAQAIRAGSSWLVIGRPITQADDPLQVLERINLDIEDALHGS